MIWFGTDESLKIWLLAVAAMPPVAVATVSAVIGTPQPLVEAVKALGATRLGIIRDVVLPAALPEGPYRDEDRCRGRLLLGGGR
ncbi:MAG: ABC transporter permease subunit [Dermatophilaceae bacterium]